MPMDGSVGVSGVVDQVKVVQADFPAAKPDAHAH